MPTNRRANTTERRRRCSRNARALRIVAVASWLTAGFLPVAIAQGHAATIPTVLLLVFASLVWWLAQPSRDDIPATHGPAQSEPRAERHGAAATSEPTQAYPPPADSPPTDSPPADSPPAESPGAEEGLDRARDALLSNVSHELRTPLTSIIAATEILRNFAADEPQVRFEFLDMIDKEAHRLLDSIGSFLRLAELEAEEVELELTDVDFRDIVNEAVQASAETAATSDADPITQRVPTTPVMVRCDRARMLEVVRRLIDNAIKFARPKFGVGRSSVELVLEHETDVAALSVLDDGPGVPPSQRGRLFTRFGCDPDLDNVLTDKPRGVGLGLPICAGIVAAHGGTLRYSDRDYRGACFTVSMPILMPARRANTALESRDPQPQLR